MFLGSVIIDFINLVEVFLKWVLRPNTWRAVHWWWKLIVGLGKFFAVCTRFVAVLSHVIIWLDHDKVGVFVFVLACCLFLVDLIFVNVVYLRKVTLFLPRYPICLHKELRDNIWLWVLVFWTIEADICFLIFDLFFWIYNLDCIW